LSNAAEKNKLMSRIAAASSSSQILSHQAIISQRDGDSAQFYEINRPQSSAPGSFTDGNWAEQFQPSQFPFVPPQMNIQPEYRHPVPPMLQHFGPPLYQNPVYTPPAYATSISTTQANKAEDSYSVNDDLAAAKRMVEMLRKSGNPKYANSTFVDFIDQVANRELRFKDGEVVDKDGKVVNWDSIYETDGQDVGVGSMLEGIGDDSENLPDQMERIWNELRGDNEWLQDGRAGDYQFKYSDNSYIESNENLIELALRLMKENKDIEAMKALEAEVRVNPNSSEGWKLLGQMHAQFDCDSEAIKCLEKGHACDAYNLESMMALGVSLTNELDSIRAMEIFKQWISNHDIYHDLAHLEVDKSPVPDYDFVGLKKEVFSMFQSASVRNPNDFDLAIALGVLHNINRDYALAIESFVRAVEIRPSDFTAWNKLGATLANSGLSREALSAYHQALSIKPNYARAWSNLAIAHSNMNDYENASKFFITALRLSPNATHIWSSLFIALSNWVPERHEISDLVEAKNIQGLAAVIENLPEIDKLPQSKNPNVHVLNDLKRMLMIE
jgi:peroxin-5